MFHWNKRKRKVLLWKKVKKRIPFTYISCNVLSRFQFDLCDISYSSSLDFEKLNLLFQQWEERWQRLHCQPHIFWRVLKGRSLPEKNAPRMTSLPRIPKGARMLPSSLNFILKSAEDWYQACCFQKLFLKMMMTFLWFPSCSSFPVLHDSSEITKRSSTNTFIIHGL